jgi:hypothetical protein
MSFAVNMPPLIQDPLLPGHDDGAFMSTHLDGPDQIELLVRIEVATNIGKLPVPQLPERIRDFGNRGCGSCMYGVYSQIISQEVDGFTPNIDGIGDMMSGFELGLEAITGLKFAYEKRVHLVSQVIAAWSTETARD